MRYMKLAYRLLVVMLVVLACSCASVGSVAHAETLSATGAVTDQSVFPTGAATDQAAADTNLKSLEAQAAAAGIGVRTVKGVKIFHTTDGQDLTMVKCCDGSDDVLDQYGEPISLETALQWQLGLPISGEAYRNIPENSSQRSIVSALSVVKIPNPVPYSQKDPAWASVLLGTSQQYPNGPNPSLRPTIGAEGCMVTSSAMEAATYLLRISGTIVVTPATLNTWLVSNGGFDLDTKELYYNNMNFGKMVLLTGIWAVWRSALHSEVTVAGIYSTARTMIAGTFNTAAKPSLPIVLMNKTGIPEHHCAWYGTDGYYDSTASPKYNARSNFIIQPTLTNYSNDSLKCSFDPNDPLGGNNGYLPVNGQSLMVVACWRK